MAIFGSLEVVKNQVDEKKFSKAFEYIEEALVTGSDVNKRLLALSLDSFVKVPLDANNFGLEQVYNSKERDQCFFESHKQYIDVQFILEGEEIIEVAQTQDLVTNMSYSEEMDLIKYEDSKGSSIRLQKGDVAIFYPEDAHMPCLKIENSVKVVKTVVKVCM